MRKLCMSLVLTLVASVAVAHHHDQKPKGPQPDAKVRELDAMVGTWQCRGIAYANPMAPEHPTEGVATLDWTANGFWLAYTYAEKKTAENPLPFWVSGFMGYDAEQKQLVNGSVDNFGGWSTSSSTGWNGDTLVWLGPWHMPTGTVNGRDTFVKKANGEMTHSAEIEMDGKWVKLGEETCKKK